MKNIETAIEEAWQIYRGEETYDPGYPIKASGNFADGFKVGANWMLANQWRSVEKDGLPKPKDYQISLIPSIGSDKPTIWVIDSFLLFVEYKDGSGYDYCEANFKVLPDGSFVWIYYDIDSETGNFTVTHWMPIPPPPKDRKEGDK